MNASVVRCYKNGIRLSNESIASRKLADVNLTVGKHPITDRVCHEFHAFFEDKSTVHLFDAQVVSIAAYGFRVRGIEFSPKGIEVAQEVWCDVRGVPTVP